MSLLCSYFNNIFKINFTSNNYDHFDMQYLLKTEFLLILTLKKKQLDYESIS